MTAALTARRVAIVGAGPRAAYALERLATLSASYAVELPTVDVIAPGTALGPGEIYAAGQPPYLRLNVSSSVINAWQVNGVEPAGESFDAWRERRLPGSSADEFPPRSTAGGYLADFGTQQRARVPGARLEGLVTSIRRSGDGFEVRWTDAHARLHSHDYEEVLLAIGHATDWDGALRVGWPSDLALLPGVYPVRRLERSTALREAPKGATVVIRGAALTAIDAVLAIAEHHPGLHIVLASRTGKLMSPKTDPVVLAGHADARAVLAEGRDRLCQPRTSVPRELVRTARALLASFLDVEDEDWDRCLRSLLAPAGPADHTGWLAHRLAVAVGRADPDPAWALGEVWRGLYPTLVARQAARDTETPTLGWSEYAHWSTELERLAFGPPVVNATALLELMRRGVVEVCAVDDVAALARERRAVLTVDAVLAPPGVRQVSDPLVTALLADRLISVAPRGRGVLIDNAGSCMVGGRAVGGLAAVGRITEDVVMGNDTLTRTMHPQLHSWAERVLGVEELVRKASRVRASQVKKEQTLHG